MNSNSKQLILDIKVDNTNPTWEDFIVDDSNRLAFSTLSSDINKWLSYLVLIYGPKNCGKTMLLDLWVDKNQGIKINNFKEMEQAITNKAYANNNNNNTVTFAIDMNDEQISLLRSDRKNQEIFFHFLNFIKNNNGRLLIVSRTAPRSWGIQTKDLLSRLNAGNTIEITQPSDNLLLYSLQKLLSDKQIKVDQAVLNYALKHSERSLAAVNEIADSIEKIAAEEKSKISIQKLKKRLS